MATDGGTRQIETDVPRRGTGRDGEEKGEGERRGRGREGKGGKGNDMDTGKAVIVCM